jgi:hypothetical protein
MSAERKQTVFVWDRRPHKIIVYPKSTAVWSAVGKYMGDRLEVQGRNRGAAIRQWIEAARGKLKNGHAAGDGRIDDKGGALAAGVINDAGTRSA